MPKRIDIPLQPIDWLLRRAAERFPDHDALVFYGRRFTYRWLDQAADRAAAGFVKLGLRKGDRVALVLPNLPSYPAAFFGTVRAGGIVVQVNPLYTEREITAILKDSGAAAVVTLDIFHRKVAASAASAGAKHVLVSDAGAYLPKLLALLYPIKKRKEKHELPPKGAALTSFDAMLDAPAPPQSVAADPANDVVVLQYTGGTTGEPKGAMLTHTNLLANALQCQAWLADLQEGKEVWLSVIPFFHVYGLTVSLNTPIAVGATMVVHPNPREIGALLKLIKKHRPTRFPGVPTLYAAINQHPKAGRYDLHSVRSCISGAAPLPAEVRKVFEARTGGKLVEGYGLSEASPVTHANPLVGLAKDGTIGLPFPSTEAKVVDAETGTKDLPSGEAGELVIRGPQVMKGYWNRPQETAAVLRDGWLHTGDIAAVDEDGYFRIVDRKKDLILVSGFNVYPREVEEVLYEHPAVLEAAAIGEPDPVKGEIVKAFVVLKPGASATAEEVIAFCKTKVAPFKVPKKVEFRQELPKTLVGKVLRRALRET